MHLLSEQKINNPLFQYSNDHVRERSVIFKRGSLTEEKTRKPVWKRRRMNVWSWACPSQTPCCESSFLPRDLVRRASMRILLSEASESTRPNLDWLSVLSRFLPVSLWVVIYSYLNSFSVWELEYSTVCICIARLICFFSDRGKTSLISEMLNCVSFVYRIELEICPTGQLQTWLILLDHM